MIFLKFIRYFPGGLPLLGVGLLALLAGLPVGAALPDDDPQARSLTRKTRGHSQNANIEFERGLLGRGPQGQWFLGDRALVMTEDSRVSSRADALGLATLEEGAEAMVLGELRNGQLVVQRVLMLGQDESIKRGTFNLRRVEEPLRKSGQKDPR